MGTNISDYQEQLRIRTEYANEVIQKYLPVEEGYLTELVSAMNYSVMVGGKRLRPVFIDSVYRLMGGKSEIREPFMAAMEYLHTYSLVHDDMPEIDNDELRRGKPTTHRKYGEACGLLAGDGLLHWSTQTAMKAFLYADAAKTMDAAVHALSVFAEKSGPHGMLGGQSVDVLFTGKHPEKERLDYIYRLKTCALIEASMMMGAILAGAGNESVAQFEDIGRSVGMAFQIQDDILDCTGDAALLGKPLNSDEKNGKTTYVTLFGIDTARAEVERLSENARQALESVDSADENEKQFLLWLIESLVKRMY